MASLAIPAKPLAAPHRAPQLSRWTGLFLGLEHVQGRKTPPAGAAATAWGHPCFRSRWRRTCRPSRGLCGPESGSQDRGRRARDKLRPDGEGPSQESARKAGPRHVPLCPRPAGEAPGRLCQAGSGCRRTGVLGTWASAAGRTREAEPGNLPLWTGLPAMVPVQPWAGGAKEGGGRSAPGLLSPLPRVPPAEQGQCVALSLAGPPGPRSLGDFSIFSISWQRGGRVCPMVSGVWRPAASSEALETHPPDARSPRRWGPETGRPWGVRGTDRRRHRRLPPTRLQALHPRPPFAGSGVLLPTLNPPKSRLSPRPRSAKTERSA